ncbi:serine hydrolase [Halalkalibaculum roseum]|nr:serine hydrolase [Halalkalibaculum roseum]
MNRLFMVLKAGIMILLIAHTSVAQQVSGTETAATAINNSNLPFVLPDSAVKPLRSLVDEELQNSLIATLSANPKWKKLIDQKKMALGLVDLRDLTDINFARINGNYMMYAASLPKIAILLAAMDAFEKGELKETEEIRKDLKLMISRSDNRASTRMIDRLGYEKIESVMTDPKYALYDEDYGGGLWVGKRYASAGRRYPDPIKGLSHAATASQVSRFYYLLASGRLVNAERSKQMLNILEDPALHHKFVNTLDKIAPNARLFRKSGSWRNYHSDSILVWGAPSRRYILVALIEDPDGEQIMRKLVVPVEQVLNNFTESGQ